jgi:hypothetical protein
MANSLGGISLAAIAEQTLDYLGSQFFMVSAFTRDFSQDIRNRGASVTTRVPSSVTAQDLSSGYSATDVTSTAKTVTLSNFKGFVTGLTDKEVSLAGNQQWLQRIFVEPAVEATCKAVVDDLLALVLNANFSANQVITAANFDSDDLADLAGDLTTAKVPKSLRSALISPAYNASLQKDAAIQDASAYGSPDAVREHKAGMIHGFGIHEYEAIPTNSENLAGFVCHPSALLIAARQVAAPISPRVEVLNAVEPKTGLPLQFRYWYDRDGGKYKFSVGLLYGVAVGNGAALKRIKSA